MILKLSLFIAMLLTAACSDPECAPGEHRVAKRCVLNPRAAADSAVEAASDAGSFSADSSSPPTAKVAEAGAVRVQRDASNPLDGRAPSVAAEPEDAGPAEAGLEACSQEGELRCATNGVGRRQRCAGGHWLASSPCGANEICESTTSDPAECRALLDVCKGNANKHVCDGATLQQCSGSGASAGLTTCKSQQHCQLGVASGECATCLPGEFRCTGAELEVCGPDGRAFTLQKRCESAALCNASAGECTSQACLPDSKTCKGDVLQVCNDEQTAYEDEETCPPSLCDAKGKQCDACVPGATTCEGKNVSTCSADGQGYTRTGCPGETPVCTGKGACVQCAAASDCAPPRDDCFVATCNTASGTCGTTPKAVGASCATGVCDGAGKCVRCLGREQCGATEVCRDNACAPAPRCGDGTKDPGEECDDGNRVTTDACLNDCRAAKCGDGIIRQGIEECEPTAGDVWSCTSECKKRTLYGSCASNSDCTASEACFLNVCTQACPSNGSSTGCPSTPSPTQAICSFGNGLGTPGYCVALGCQTGKDCAPGVGCIQASPRPYCAGCRKNDECAPGKVCSSNDGMTPGLCL